MARHALRWMFRQPWSTALAGVIVIAVGIANVVRTEDKISAGVLTALGTFAVVGAIVARIKTGTWGKAPDDDTDASSSTT